MPTKLIASGSGTGWRGGRGHRYPQEYANGSMNSGDNCLDIYRELSRV